MTTTVTEPAEQSAADDAQAQADFEAGAAMETGSGPKTTTQDDGQPRDEAGRFTTPKPDDKPAQAAATPAAKPEPAPEYVQITRQQFERWEAAAKLTDDHGKQFSKAFGSIGDVQKIVKGLQAGTPRGVAVKIPDGAFDAMDKDYPELAKHTRAALEATLKGLEGTGGASAHVDTTEFKKEISAEVQRLQFEDLEDAYPDWAQIVGAVNTQKGEKPDPNNAFRKWLATKDQAYQDRINGTNSAGVITRAIRVFKSETRAAPAPAKTDPKLDPRAVARTNRINDAVRPRGDGGQPPVKGAEDDFEAGFRSG